jgi:hypothetical protein
VRFVDDNQIDRVAGQLRQERRVSEALRGGEHEFRRTVVDRLFGRCLLRGVLGAVERDRAHADLVELVDLVFHQRDQGRDDQRTARKPERR